MVLCLTHCAETCGDFCQSVFGQEEVKFLSHQVSASGIWSVPGHVQGSCFPSPMRFRVCFRPVAKSALAAAAKLKHPHTDLPISHMLEWSMPQTGSCWLSTPRSATSGSYWKRGSSSFSPTTNPSASQSNGMVEWMHQQLKAGFICI